MGVITRVIIPDSFAESASLEEQWGSAVANRMNNGGEFGQDKCTREDLHMKFMARFRMNPANRFYRKAHSKVAVVQSTAKLFRPPLTSAPWGKRNFDSGLSAQQFHLVYGLNLPPQ
ncbi:hypothetical protein CEXT_710191 [Caerostris extrusa]|uniref:Uncharacterized protein n=1 Tax=Caerostris extrusa TaxID=172846 RepID=A0AAV4NXA3_CAEEX|nr:hypothetical protein CEXT_710191 [Caerostris extrusa]